MSLPDSRITPYKPAPSRGPQRVRVSWRHPGGRKPAGTVYVGRPSRWGNPFPVAEYGRARAIALYRQYLAEHPQLAAAARRELAGWDLACWCAPGQPCHGDVLLEEVNDLLLW